MGILQGIAEFLPISSSGHLVLARALMGLEDVPILFDVILHLATLVVVIWVFRRRIGGILVALFHWATRRIQEQDKVNLVLAWRLIVASAVTAVMGLTISRFEVVNDPLLVSALLLVTAAVLIATRWTRGSQTMEQIGGIQAIAMGAAQGLGVFSGISRAGLTIASGLLLGLDRKAAGEFSFLLSIPAILGAFLLTLKDAGEMSTAVPFVSLAVGFLAAMAAGYVSLRLLLWLVANGRLWCFAFYLVPVGVLGLLYFGA